MKATETLKGALGLTRDLLRASYYLPEVERYRRSTGPRPYLERIRSDAGHGKPSSTLGLAVRIVDRLMPSGQNCYRRALLQMRLDPELARSSLYVGLRFEGDRAKGHAWVRGDEPTERYDVIVEL